MDEQQQQPLETSAPTAPAVETSAPSGHIDPEDYAALQSRLSQYEALTQRLSPYASDIQWMVENPDYAPNLVRDARKAYDRVREESGPQVPQELQPIVSKLSRLEKIADDYERQQKEIQEAPQREFANRWQAWQTDPRNEKFYNRLKTEHPDLTNRDMAYLAQTAADNGFEPLEQVWKSNEWRFVPQARTAPPPSLRTDSGEVGIPGAANGQTQEKSVRDRVIELERARRSIA